MATVSRPGQVIFLNGTSSSGKTTLAHGLQGSLGPAHMHLSVDRFIMQLPKQYLTNKQWLADHIDVLLTGFNAGNAAIVSAGNNVIIDHVIQEPDWLAETLDAFDGLSVYFVGVHCSLVELERREAKRGDREEGLARYQFERVHTGKIYDVEVDTSRATITSCVAAVRQRMASPPTAFSKMRAAS